MPAWDVRSNLRPPFTECRKDNLLEVLAGKVFYYWRWLVQWEGADGIVAGPLAVETAQIDNICQQQQGTIDRHAGCKPNTSRMAHCHEVHSSQPNSMQQLSLL